MQNILLVFRPGKNRLLDMSGDIKTISYIKKALKMTSQVVISRAFLFIFFRPIDPKSEKNPVNQLIQNSGLILNLMLGLTKLGKLPGILDKSHAYLALLTNFSSKIIQHKRQITKKNKNSYFVSSITSHSVNNDI